MATRRRTTKTERPEESADWPIGMPYTLYFPRRDGYAAADIEYAAPLPRVGDTVEYIDHQGVSRWYVVSDVVHTFQDQPDAAERISLLRGGIPAVYLTRAGRRRARRTISP